MHSLFSDLAFAIRQLTKHRIYAIAAIVSMALGIAATAAVYSVLYGVLIDPFPYKSADRIAVINLHNKDGDQGTIPLTLAEADEMRKASTVADVLAQRVFPMSVNDVDLPISTQVLEFTGNGFDFMKAPPLLGRTFNAKEAPEGHAPPPIAVVSYRFWKNHFAGAPDVIGKTLTLDHQKFTVIGVMGPRFTWVDCDVYLPIPASVNAKTQYSTLLRLKPGATFSATQAEMDSFVRQIGHGDPNVLPKGDFTVTVDKLSDSLLGHFKGTLYLLFASVGLLLLIGCGNVSILMLARGTSRQQELCMRAALGASRARIVRQLLTESVTLSFAGGLLGMGLAWLAIRLIVDVLPEYAIPHEVIIQLNVPVLLFSAAIAIATGILSGLLPALQFSKPNLNLMLKDGDSRTASSRGARLRLAMIAGQVALTVVLLAGSGAAMKTFLKAYTADLGFDPHNSLILFLGVPHGSYTTWESRAHYLDALVEKVKNTPGILDASTFSVGLPPNANWSQPINLIGAPADNGRRASLLLIDADYFSTQRIPLLQGRFLNRSEVLRGAHLAVVSQTFARRYFPSSSPLGQEVVPTELQTRAEQASARAPTADPASEHPFAAPNLKQPYEIIGVVGDTRDAGFYQPIEPQIYVPYTTLIFPETILLVRTAADPHLSLHAIGASMQALEKEQVISEEHTYEEILSEFDWAHERFLSILFTVFAAVALSLAAIGLFSLVTYSVEQRTREIGIRMALGSSRLNVLIVTIRSTALTTAIGIIVGIGLSISLSGYVQQWTLSSMRDTGVLILISGVFLLASVAACIIPARKATRIDPVVALRSS